MTRRPRDTVRCPECLRRRLKATDSIACDDGSIIRRRVCIHCGHKWTTREQIDGSTKKTSFG